ncbi:hypothetical protein OH76DRAFT_1413003 [Lentinus brumalis]|uniref:Uncharacterized protein n=1 Tax=Lentinus brumalis TaxID=2498619 RepID=A0A371CJF2_9APHY|nr:hypothetical protein OH76DRAFT_1413003 [Polyporus brumalis]
MDAHSVVRKTLRVFVSSVSKLEDDEEWLEPLPSPPPPTPSNARCGVSYDMQRFDPFRVMMAASTPHFTSPTSPEFAIEYPKLPDSLIFRFPAAHEEDGSGSTEPQSNEADDLFADPEDFSPDSSFEIATPADVSGDFGTTFHFEGAEDGGEYEIDRTILRAAGKHHKSGLSGSLARLATRSTATLRTMSSFQRFSASSSASASASGDSDSEDPYTGISAPPASLLASRRPSIAPGASALALPSSLSSPVSAIEVVKSLRRLAASLTLDCAGHGAEKHFEEAVGHYEKAWALDESIEVHVDRTEAVSYEDRDDDRDFEFGFPARPDGIGLYARA